MRPPMRKLSRFILARFPRLKVLVKRILLRYRGAKSVSIKVLGTSNAIISTGYVAKLKQIEGVTLAANLSVGSSHACLVPNALKQDDPQIQTDVFLLDLCVNEQRAQSKGLYNVEISEIALDYFLSHCANIGVSPLILLLPQINDQGTLSLDAVKRWKRLCRRKRVSYIDVHKLSKRQGLPQYLWQDQNHPNALFSDVIAHEIFEKARRMTAKRVQPAKTRDQFQIYTALPEPRVTRSTSMMSKDFSQLVEGDTFEVSLSGSEDFEVFGVALNMAQTHAAITFEGKQVVTQRFDNAYYDPKKALWYVIWSLVEPAHSQNGKMTMRMVNPQDSKNQLKNDHIEGSINRHHGRKTAMEIEALILRKISLN